MLTYSFSDIGSDSLYEHLYKCIKKDILSGILKPGEKLPSKRNFAKNLGISVITVENAYQNLLAEGYIYSIAKKGYYIADIKSEFPYEKVKNLTKKEIKEKPISPYIADFTSNFGLLEQFPFTVWNKLLRQCMKDYENEFLINSPSAGEVELRKAIAKHLLEFRNMKVDIEQIIVGTGTEYLYGQIIQLLGHDKIYGLEDPGYKKMSQVYNANDVTTKYIRFEKEGISIADLERQNVDVAHTSLSHQFPTGVVTPISKRYELLGWASKDKKRYIIEDDYDSEFRMISKPIPTLMSIDNIEKVIYMNTFSKSLSSTLRVSYMILPKNLMNLYYEKLSFYSSPVSKIIQLCLAKFIDEGYFEKHINRMRNYYRKQRDILLKYIQESPMAPYTKISEEDAGLHFLLNLNIKQSDEEFKKSMQRRRININPLSEYYQIEENKTEHDFIINYSSLTSNQMQQAVKQLSEEVIKLKNEE